jgi:hypothetical protein
MRSRESVANRITISASIASKINYFSDLPDFDAAIVTSPFCIRRRGRPSQRRDRTNRSTPSARPSLPFSPADRSWIQREPIALAVEASPRVEVEFMHPVGAPDTPNASPEAMKEVRQRLSRVRTPLLWQSPTYSNRTAFILYFSSRLGVFGDIKSPTRR